MVLEQLAEERDRGGERLKKPWGLRQLGKLANLARGTSRELSLWRR